MGTSIGDARASIRSQSTDRLTEDPLVTGLQRDGLYVDPGSRALEHSDRSSPLPRPLHTGDAVLIAMFGRLRTSTITKLTLADDLKPLGVTLRVHNLKAPTSTSRGARGALPARSP